MLAMPAGMSPGDQPLLLVATDENGASGQHLAYMPAEGANGHIVFGPHHINAGESTPITVNILNDRPLLLAEPLSVEKGADESTIFTVQSSDPDGIERVQINLGVYAPVGVSSWVSMYDDGINGGDVVAGDGVYSVLLSIRDGTPLGTHEVFVRSLDNFGELNTTSTVITLQAPEDPVLGDGGLSGAVLGVVGLVVLIGAGAVLALMWRRQEGDDGIDRFGSQ
jgi:hypothetical protein